LLCPLSPLDILFLLFGWRASRHLIGPGGYRPVKGIPPSVRYRWLDIVLVGLAMAYFATAAVLAVMMRRF
jgi:hypothetical protein